MTTPKPPLPRETNSPSAQPTKTPWYAVPVLWVGLVITIMLVAGLIHLAIMGHRYASDALESGSKSTEITHIRGMPLGLEPSSTPKD